MSRAARPARSGLSSHGMSLNIIGRQLAAELRAVVETSACVTVNVLKRLDITGTRKIVGRAKRGDTVRLFFDGDAALELAADAFGLFIAERPRRKGAERDECEHLDMN